MVRPRKVSFMVRKACAFQSPGEFGKYCSYMDRAEITVIRSRSGTTPGKKRCADCCTQPDSEFVTMKTEPEQSARCSRSMTDASRARRSCSTCCENFSLV